tara:strand:- start:1492 stop:3780 length:2289 start_codon:yes stop_codon:yes gene_type:complete
MIEQGLLRRHFLGRDGFIWWIGQIVDQTQWSANLPGAPTKTTEEQRGFDFRYKVRIMGYHTACPGDLKDEELPWASVMFPVTAGVSGGGLSTPNLRQGNFVYGFFIDGEDAQQPVIMGVMGYNQYVAILKDPPEGEECGFKPFSGYTINDKAAKHSLPTVQENAKAFPEGVKGKVVNNKDLTESASGVVSRDTADDGQQFKEESKNLTIGRTSECDPSAVGGIQTSIQKMLSEVNEIKKTATEWEAKVTSNVNNIEYEINKVTDKYTREVTANVKRIITGVQQNTILKVNNVLKDSYYQLFPSDRPALKKEVEQANDILACAFRNIVKNLLGMVGGFLSQILDRFINTPLCAVENFVGSLLGKITGLIDGIVGAVMGPIKSLLAGLGAATGMLDDLVGFATNALSFLSCDETPSCGSIEEWNPINGAKPVATLDLNSIFGKAKAAAAGVQDAIEGVANIGDAISDVAKNANFADIFEDTCNVGPIFCGPPTVEFIGGGGSGATGNVIVSAVTTVLGVDIITPGGGYIGPPRLKFNDSCNKGQGATGKAVIEDGKVVKVIMEDTGYGYLPAPNGSQGGDGRTWANEDETTIKRGDGTYDTPYKPGVVVTVCDGDEVTYAGGTTELIEGGCVDITTPFPGDPSVGGLDPSLGTGQYPVVLEIDEINILDPGVGYDCSKDKVVIEPSNGAELTLKCDALGSIIGVDVVNGGIGFKEDPKIYIQSDSGYNAELIPTFKVNRVGEVGEDEVIPPTSLIQVIDCVGKV